MSGNQFFGPGSSFLPQVPNQGVTPPAAYASLDTGIARSPVANLLPNTGASYGLPGNLLGDNMMGDINMPGGGGLPGMGGVPAYLERGSNLEGPLGNIPGADMGNGQSMLGGMLPWKDTKTGMNHGGWGSTALGLASAGMNAYLGLKQLGVMKDTLKFQKNSFNKQFTAQQTLTNSNLRDRQDRRFEASGGAVMSTDDYMKKNRV